MNVVANMIASELERKKDLSYDYFIITIRKKYKQLN